MYLKEEVKTKIRTLSSLARKVYGIKKDEEIKFKKHPEFVNAIIKDITNIGYNLAIADRISSEEEKKFVLYTIKEIFYPNTTPSHGLLMSMSKQFDSYQDSTPEIQSPIYILEQAKYYDKQFKTQITPDLRNCIVSFAQALVMIDGFESVREFDVLETFRMWVEKIK